MIPLSVWALAALGLLALLFLCCWQAAEMELRGHEERLRREREEKDQWRAKYWSLVADPRLEDEPLERDPPNPWRRSS